jgi:hypothetical protein
MSGQIRLAICGLAITVVNYGYSIPDIKESQRTTFAQLWTVNFAVIRYAQAHNRYPPASDIVELSRFFKEKQRRDLLACKQDPWGNRISYVTSPDSKRYVIASPGKNRDFEKDIRNYLYDLPAIEFFEEASSFDDLVIANECDRRVPSGMTGNCFEDSVSLVVLKNLRDVLKIYLELKHRYPEKLSLDVLKDSLASFPSVPYELADHDGWRNTITYIRSKDERSYLLASPGKDGKFQYVLEKFLKKKNRQVHLKPNDNNDVIIVNGTARLLERGQVF